MVVMMLRRYVACTVLDRRNLEELLGIYLELDFSKVERSSGFLCCWWIH